MKSRILSLTTLLLLTLALGLAACTDDDDEITVSDPREGTVYFAVKITDATPSGVDGMSEATPGADLDAVGLVQNGTEIYADAVGSSSLGLTEPFPGLENPELALGEPTWPDGFCVAGDLAFFGMAGAGGYALLIFSDTDVKAGDTIRVYECDNGPFLDEVYNVYVGASTDPNDPSWVEIATDQRGVLDFVVPALPALPAK
jgi:hypothetical protein